QRKLPKLNGKSCLGLAPPSPKRDTPRSSLSSPKPYTGHVWAWLLQVPNVTHEDLPIAWQAHQALKACHVWCVTMPNVTCSLKAKQSKPKFHSSEATTHAWCLWPKCDSLDRRPSRIVFNQ
ncbi:hypothetical protein PIB30_047513, partial [Stylosanthes scabra]|nr:hypothetical protein [Stylosanthes scabra]